MPLLYLCICFVMTKMIVGVGKCVYSSVHVPVPVQWKLLVGEEHVDKVESLCSHSVIKVQNCDDIHVLKRPSLDPST